MRKDWAQRGANVERKCSNHIINRAIGAQFKRNLQTVFVAIDRRNRTEMQYARRIQRRSDLCTCRISKLRNRLVHMRLSAAIGDGDDDQKHRLLGCGGGIGHR